MDLEQDIKEILSTRKKVLEFFLLSIPGALWLTEKLVVEGYAEKIYHIAHGDALDANLIPLVLAFVLWLIPFELAEKNMSDLKQHIRDYMTRSGETLSPIQFTPVEKFVNIAMIPLFDKSPLPPDH